MKRIIATLLVAIMLVPTASLTAGEGMWIPLLMKKLNYKDMRKAGLKLSVKDMYSVNHGSLKDAIVSLNGGSCTAEIISSKAFYSRTTTVVLMPFAATQPWRTITWRMAFGP